MSSVVTEPETYQGAVKRIQKIAAHDFAEHQLEETGKNEWRCGRPSSGYYAFYVIVRPYTVILYGDIGEAIFRCNDDDALGWLKQAAYSPGYLLEKLRTTDRSQEPWEFFPGDALAYLRDIIADEEEGSARRVKWERVLQDAERLEGWGEFNRDTWRDLIVEAGGDFEMVGVALKRPASNQWFVEALRWLVETLEKPQPTTTPTT